MVYINYSQTDFKRKKGKNMKKAFRFLGVIALATIAGISFYACGDNDPNGSTTTFKTMASSPDSVTYIMEGVLDASRSAIGRSLVINNEYDFTIIKPRSQASAGAAENFDSETITVTVIERNMVGNRERFTMQRADDNTTFFITFNSDGTIHGIQGLAGAKDGYLNAIGENSSGLYGKWVGFYIDSNDMVCPASFLVTGDYMFIQSVIIGQDGDYMGSGTSETRMPIILPISNNTINFAQDQTGRFQTDGEGGTGDQWVPLIAGGYNENVDNITKSIEYDITGDIMTATVTAVWVGGTGMVGIPLEFRRVPTN
jgi:hypothetical protein